MKSFILSLFIIFTYAATGQQLFQKSINSGWPFTIRASNDDILLFSGIGMGGDSAGLFVTRLDPSGNFKWKKSIRTCYGYSCSSPFIVSATKETNDGSFVILGQNYVSLGGSNANEYQKLVFFKMDSTGNVQWYNNFYPAVNYLFSYYYAGNIELLPGGNASLSFGFVSSYPSGLNGLGLMIIDSLGNIISKKRFSLPANENPLYNNRTADNGFILGTSYYSTTSNFDFITIKTDSNTNVTWAKSIGTVNQDRLHGVIPVGDGYLLYGHTVISQTDNDILIVKLDLSGNVTWTKTIGSVEMEYLTSVKAVPSGYIICGSTHWTPNTLYDILLLKLDPLGNPLWSRRMGSNGHDYATSLTLLSDALLVAGYSPGFQYRTYLVKTDTTGYTPCNQDTSILNISAANVTTNTVTLSPPDTFVGEKFPNVVDYRSSYAIAKTLCPACFSPYPSTITANGPTSFCPWGSVTLTANPGLSYLWSNGDTISSVFVSTTGTYTVKVFDTNGCATPSAPVTVNAFSAPSPIVSKLDDTTLISSPALHYQWYFHSTLLPNDTNQTLIVPPLSAIYIIEVIDTNGCIGSSAYHYYPLAIKEPNTGNENWYYPNPARNELTIQTLDKAEIIIKNIAGTTVIKLNLLKGTQKISLPERLSAGSYFIEKREKERVDRGRFMLIR
jgi:hypothetical protein